MSTARSSSFFTKRFEAAVGPPLIGALLRMPVDVVRTRMLERLRLEGCDGIEPAHLIVFQYPGPQNARPSELADRLRISKQALNYLLGQLERLGYLGRQPDDEDQRGKRIVLTERGNRVLYVIRDAVAEIEADWTQKLGPERFAQLRELLLELNDLPGGD